jgi:hypothetical protein
VCLPFKECDVYDPVNPRRLPTRPHNKIYHKLRLEMGEYVEQDMATGTPGVSNWKYIERHFPYQVPHQWQPDRPHYVLHDSKKQRKRLPGVKYD